MISCLQWKNALSFNIVNAFSGEMKVMRNKDPTCVFGYITWITFCQSHCELLLLLSEEGKIVVFWISCKWVAIKLKPYENELLLISLTKIHKLYNEYDNELLPRGKNVLSFEFCANESCGKIKITRKISNHLRLWLKVIQVM